MSISFRGRVATLALSTFAALALAPAAHAADCGMPTSKPFAPWLDYSSYTLLPGGDFEGGVLPWSLVGASVTNGNESFQVSGPGTSSLSIPRGATATSPAFCGGLDHPTLRLFAKGGGLLGLLSVNVTYVDSQSVLRSQSLGVVTASSSWRPSLPLLTLSGLPIVTGSSMRITLTAIGGDFSVDDVYVDPYAKRL
ncbi:MAG: hypothetical protein QOG68_122 [Solirubrobacteraceae bacterium]|nr:hypothetical protein [Solirubrobacteraceae bacterium]